jgi:hypothetical protein
MAANAHDPLDVLDDVDVVFDDEVFEQRFLQFRYDIEGGE